MEALEHRDPFAEMIRAEYGAFLDPNQLAAEYPQNETLARRAQINTEVAQFSDQLHGQGTAQSDEAFLEEHGISLRAMTAEELTVIATHEAQVQYAVSEARTAYFAMLQWLNRRGNASNKAIDIFPKL